MTKVNKKEVEIENLSSILFSTLEEDVFFGHLGSFLHSHVSASITKIYLIQQDQSAELISLIGKSGLDISKKLDKGVGVVGHVVRTKRPYFSNSVSRDPLFQREATLGVKAELCVPVIHEGIVIATVHHQHVDEENEFSRDDISDVLSVINEIKSPIANIKMYLSAKFLNETLLKQIEAKEIELKEKESGMNLASTYKVQDKQIVGKSESMQNLIRIVEKVAASSANCLLNGESGTGKQMIARKIHCLSQRKDSAFITIDCDSIDLERAESEIFGNELIQSGGMTVKNGLLELANGGTLFLNNIDKLPLSTQAKLASFIANGIAFRVNGQMPYRSDVRVIGASTKELIDEVEAGSFRDDLFYSLNTVDIIVPSLRERKEDIEVLANHFLNKDRSTDEHKSMSPCVMKKLLEYSWPGNVRELQSVMERAYILADGMIIESDHLAESVQRDQEAEVTDVEEVDYTEMTLDELERRHICKTLEFLGGNKTKTAKTLGITVKTLYNKLHSYGMIASKEA